MSYCTAIPKESFIYFPRGLNQIEVGIPASLVDLNWQQCVTPTEMKSGQPDTASLQQKYAISPPTGIQLSLRLQFSKQRTKVPSWVLFTRLSGTRSLRQVGKGVNNNSSTYTHKGN